ncbi:MAG: M48 family metalloprotease [Armatimonadetes bacterium]|nr:M48 family metalloprotease [Armatimonadota bacterium]
MVRRTFWRLVWLAAFCALAGLAATALPGGLARPGSPNLRQAHDKALGQLALTSSEQADLGRVYHAQMLRETPEVRGAEATRVARLGRRLARGVRGRVRFYVLGDAHINAFSHVGGYVYVNRGLLAAISGDDELAFVLAHELGHLALGHCARAAAVSYRAAQNGGALAGALAGRAYQVATAGYSRDNEFAADAFGARLLRQRGMSTRGAVTLMQRLAGMEAIAKRERDPNDWKRRLGDHFATHPPSEERLRRLTTPSRRPSSGS